MEQGYGLPCGSIAINLGTGTGTTVREFLDAFNEVASVPIRARDAERRPGDVAGAYTRIERAVRLLDWQPQYGIADGIRHSLQWAALRHEVLSDEAPAAALRRGSQGRLDDEDRHDDRTADAAGLLPHFPGQISDRSRGEPGQYHGESHECTHITSETVAKVSQQGGGKDRGDIFSFTVESSRRAGQLYDAGFRDALMPASAQEVPQFKALLPHMVVDNGVRHVEDNRRRLGCCEPDGQFSLLTPSRPRTHSTDHAVKSAYLESQGGLQAHAGPDRVSHRIHRNRQATITAPDDPVELRRQPTGRSIGPPGKHGASGTHDIRRTVRFDQRCQPARTRLRIIIKEGGYGLRRRSKSGIASVRQSPASLVLKNCHVSELTAGSVGQLGIVVHHQQYLRWRRTL